MDYNLADSVSAGVIKLIFSVIATPSQLTFSNTMYLSFDLNYDKDPWFLSLCALAQPTTQTQAQILITYLGQ